MDLAVKEGTLKKDKPKNLQSFFMRLKKNYQSNKFLYIMAIPVVLYYVIFKYIPMFGIVIAFQDYSPAKSIFKNNWVGLKNFSEFFMGPYAWRVIRNTLELNIFQLVYGFPVPIILALLINEVKNMYFKRTVQTLSYLPHFISLVVMCGMLTDFSMSTGLFNDIITLFGLEKTNLLANMSTYRGVYIASGIWQGAGWGSIIYLATLSGVDPSLYEASVIDGAGRFKQTIHITLPALLPIIVVMLILRIGNLMSEGADKTILLYSPLVYEKADIISSFVYRRGLQEMNYSFGTAIGFLNSIINMTLLVFANWFSKKVTEESLW